MARRLVLRRKHSPEPSPAPDPGPEPQPAASGLSAADVAEPAEGPSRVRDDHESPSVVLGRPAAPSIEDETPPNMMPVVFSILPSDSSSEAALIRRHIRRQHGLVRADFIDYSREPH